MEKSVLCLKCRQSNEELDETNFINKTLHLKCIHLLRLFYWEPSFINNILDLFYQGDSSSLSCLTCRVQTTHAIWWIVQRAFQCNQTHAEYAQRDQAAANHSFEFSCWVSHILMERNLAQSSFDELWFLLYPGGLYHSRLDCNSFFLEDR